MNGFSHSFGPQTGRGFSGAFTRTDRSVIGQWWWTVDRWSLAAFLLLATIGTLMVATASPPVAERIGLEPFHFLKRHLVFLPAALAVMFAVSLMSVRMTRRLAMLALGGAVVLVLATLFTGPEIKGATRWVHIAGFSLQPSEFLKPAFAIVAAWAFAQAAATPGFPGFWIASALWAMLVALLMMQPDLGMTIVITAIWGTQLFLAGLPLSLVIMGGLLVAGGLVGAYFTLPHVASRVDRFLDPASGDTYQVQKSLDAFASGGMFGTGPGQGAVKERLPDGHADFIFSVAGEELGLFASLFIVALFAVVMLRGFWRVLSRDDLFVLLASAGLVVQLGLQALIHMGSALHLLPTKGMTLPFISYGGSSLLALGLTAGWLLALTRARDPWGETR